MGRSRVLSFMSAFGAPNRQSPEPSKSPKGTQTPVDRNSQHGFPPADGSPDPFNSGKSSRPSTRPSSMAITYQPPATDTTQDTLPELLPIFTFLNSHSNKLYQEGYFLKLNDLDTQGRPCSDRHWVECFAQLVGTVLSLWDAAALDAAGQEGEVAPTFINLGDASIKMIETLPTRNQNTQPLQNVLSISTAGKNRYLLHFNSLHSLTQWTAAIRLSLFEHTSLLEAYTGSIIAGKGKTLNNIRAIMERCKFKHEDWARVRFGAGTPWRRCWCVITPPDEKEMQKAQKTMKKRSAYDRTTPLLTGDIKFYDTKKTKKIQPIATITNAYSAYAIYPQSKPLIDQSTLVKIEGEIKIHAQAGSTTEGFVFVMPEPHPAVSGFEMLLRFLFPTFDTFGLYGRPTRLIADTNNVKSMMFAFPKEKRYGYLDVLDVANLIHTSGSENWSEKEWRKQLRAATAQRMSRRDSRASSVSGRAHPRSSLPGQGPVARFADSDESVDTPSGRLEFHHSADEINETPERAERAQVTRSDSRSRHARSASENLPHTYPRPAEKAYTPTRLSIEQAPPPAPVISSSPPAPPTHIEMPPRPDFDASNESSDYDSDRNIPETPQAEIVRQDLQPNEPPAPVVPPPAFSHDPRRAPATRPQPSWELQRATQRMSSTTLAQLADVGKMNGEARWEPSPALHQADTSERPYRDVMNEAAEPFGVNADGRAASQRTSLDEQSQQQGTMPPPPVPAHNPIPPVHLQLDTNKAQENVKALKRKPVNPQPTSNPDPVSAEQPSDSTTPASLRARIDEGALNQVMTRHSTLSTEPDLREDDDSIYDEGSATPDYASTRQSTDTKRSNASLPRPRMGVLKTVGSDESEKQEFTIGDIRYLANEKPPTVDPEIPAVDFGPTMAYLPTARRPSLSNDLKRVSASNPELNVGVNDRRPPRVLDPELAGHQRQDSSSSRDEEYRKTTMAWQPGLAAGRPQTSSGHVTPEQFVHQRAASNPRLDVNVYAHRRGSSTPPAQRPRSADWMAHNAQQQYGRESPVRPQSRGARSNLSGYNEMPSHLSAREQEHVARMTGSTFLNMSSQNARPQAPVSPGGLVSAIDARERERRDIKEGVSNHMVQYAIAQRQQQQQYWESQQGQYHAPPQGQYPAPQQVQYSAPQQAQYPAPQQVQYPAPQQGQYRAPQQGQYRVPQQGQYRAPQQYPPDQSMHNYPLADGSWDTASQMTSMQPPIHGRVSPNWNGQYPPQQTPPGFPQQTQYPQPNSHQQRPAQRYYGQ